MSKINVLFLCIDDKKNDEEPSYFFNEIGDGIVLERVVETFNPIKSEANFRFVVSSFQEKKLIETIFPKDEVVQIAPKTKGSAVSALLGSATLKKDEELLIVSVNEILNIDIQKVVSNFRKLSSDSGVISFDSLSPKYSHILLKDGKKIQGFFQYKVVSELATAGLFYFRTVEDFIDSASSLLLKGTSLNGYFYVGTVINEYILQNKVVNRFHIERKSYIPLKSTLDFINTNVNRNEGL